MIQIRSRLDVADNTGAQMATMIGGIGKQTAFASVGDVITCNVKEASASGTVKKGEVVRAVVVRRPHCEHAMVRPHDRAGDVDRTLSVPDSSARGGRKPRRQKEDSGDSGDIPDSWSLVCRTPGRHGFDRRRAHVFPGALAGADR